MTTQETTFGNVDDDVEIVYDETTNGEVADAQKEQQNADDVDDAEDGEQKEETPPPAEDIPPIPNDDDDLDEPNDAEYVSYSTSVKKRIKREIRLRKEVQEELASTTQQRDNFYNAARNGETAYLKLQKDNDNLQEQYYKLLETSLQSAIEQKTAEWSTAREQGNTTMEAQAQSAIEELRFNKRQLSEIATSFVAQKAQRAQQQPTLQAPQQQQVPQLALKWVARNKWIKEPKYAAHREYIMQLDKKLLSAGFNPNTEIYYKELDKELRKAFPSAPKSIVAPNKTGTSPVAPATNGSGVGKTKNNRIVLTRDDMDVMRKFGLDPANKAHVIAFARQRLN